MANSLAELVVNLQANTSAFSRGMQDAVGQLDRFNRNVEQRMQSLGTTLQRSFGAAAIGAAVTAAASEMVRLVDQSIDAADQMNKLSQSYGVATETLSAFGYAAKLSDVTMEELAKGMGKLAKSAVDGSAGFSRLGIATRDSQGAIRNVDDLMLDLADRFSKMPDGTLKTAVAMELLGKSGARLIPLFNQGRDGLQGMTETAKALGLVLDPGTTQAAERFNDAITEMQSRTRGFANEVAAGILPALAEISERINEIGKSGEQPGWSKVWAQIGENWGIGTIAVGHGIVNAYDILSTELKRGWALTKGDFEKVATEEELLNDRLASRWEKLKDSVFNIQNPPLGGKRNGTFFNNPGGDNGGKGAAMAAQLETARAQMQSILDRIANANGDTIQRLEREWEGYARKWQQIVSKFPQIAQEFPGVMLLLGGARDREIAAELEKQLDAIIKKAEEYRHIKPIPGIFVMPDVKAPNVPAKNPYELELDELKRNTEALGRAAEGVWYQTRTAAEAYAFELERLNVLHEEYIRTQGKAGISLETYNRALDQLKARLDRNTIAVRDFGYELGQIAQNSVTHWRGWRDMVDQLTDALIKLAFQLLVVNRIQEAMEKSGKGGGLLGGIIGGLGGSWGALSFGGLHDYPGPAYAGTSYLIGTPEIFTPKTDGYITPIRNLKAGGNSGITIEYLDARGAAPGMEGNILRAIREAEQRAVNTAVVAVEERRRRS